MDALWTLLSEGVKVGQSWTERRQRDTQNTMEGPYLSTGVGTPQASPEELEEEYREKEAKKTILQISTFYLGQGG